MDATTKGAKGMKAWSGMDYECGYGHIIFAPTRGKARSLLMCADGFDCADWTDSTIEVRRLAEMDGRRDEPGLLDWKDGERIYYEAGWYPEEGCPCCDDCLRYSYHSIPESRVIEDDSGARCMACRGESYAGALARTDGEVC